MPPFSLDNPIQALYLKKRGVERLLNRYIGGTVGVDFAKETKTKIEMESMLIDRRRRGRRREHTRKDHGEDNNGLSVVFEMVPWNETNRNREETSASASASAFALATSASAANDDYDKCPELSCYDDSDEDSDWSLPGNEERWASTDIRYIYGDGDYDDSEQRERQNAFALAEKDEERKSSSESSISTMELIANHFANYDWWIRCI